MKKIIEEYNTNKKYGYNCAEKIIRAANQKHNLELNESALTMMSGFGSGLKIQSVCGLYSASVAALGVIFTEEKSKTSPILKLAQTDFSKKFEEKFGHIHCSDLRNKEKNERIIPCNELALDTADILDEVVTKYSA